ncbi:death domain-containing protein CRADD isoform X2 [Embiotoca jacksoni]|uniref:death domain-containing protein CRADD isoform X2 n=1 Tax=Embiotoca jacksoni TaxID=100190 RepID=UPI0037043FD5
MDPEHKAVLRKHRLEVSGQLLVSDSIVPFLYQEDILTDAQVEDIESQRTDRQKSLKLLDLLPSRGPRAFSAFLRSLHDFGWIRDRLLLELQNPPGPQTTGIRSCDRRLRWLTGSLESRRLAIQHRGGAGGRHPPHAGGFPASLSAAPPEQSFPVNLTTTRRRSSDF